MSEFGIPSFGGLSIICTNVWEAVREVFRSYVSPVLMLSTDQCGKCVENSRKLTLGILVQNRAV